MPLDAYLSMLPGSDGEKHLADMVRMKVGLEYVWDAQLVLAEGEAPDIELGSSGRLGLTTWLAGDAREKDDLILVNAV